MTMQSVAITQVKNLRPEQVLAADVRDRSGRLLIPAGMAIKDKHLKVLMSWGITEVVVRDDPDATATTSTTTRQQAPTALSPDARQRLDELFRHVDLSQPHMRELHALVGVRMSTEKA